MAGELFVLGSILADSKIGWTAGRAMTDKPAKTYIVSIYEKPHWRTVLTTKDKAKAEAVLKQIGKTGQIEEIIPKVNR
ncbi:hypothetical protein [Mesorhizobium sp. L48C026A00]|uniref:hypothetical protein n=1 Tax=Mesorhizobium sp. L48C026A00 TaxID=1287182 RepID=UPI0012EBE5E0|nr:hypothetical protein [Mesorhizobium sp. L48C026A00]